MKWGEGGIQEQLGAAIAIVLFTGHPFTELNSLNTDL